MNVYSFPVPRDSNEDRIEQQQRDRIEALETALAYYADRDNWRPVFDAELEQDVSPVDMDCGLIARAALGETEAQS